MRHFSVLYFFVLFSTMAYAQKPNQTRQSSWQQHVEYVISVKLNDVNHTLSAYEKLTYTNNSPDQIREIYMHVWPNAYKNNKTAFAQQLLENDKTKFQYATEEQRGYIDSLDFKVNNKKVEWQFTENIDICKLTLNEPLAPGQSIEITTPFMVKLPKVFSRMGHEDQLYCVTQWYPKPAVYDVNGWNPMPYLDQGEFYSEYGKFDVSISVPENYVVAATGIMQNMDEMEWLMKKSEAKFSDKTTCEKTTPPSSTRYKTLRFVQDDIHDFAWFADKRFQVERSEVRLSNGKRVTTWLYQVCPKKSGVHWLDTAVSFYSSHVGNYPYDHASAVVTPLEAGGGMEYPMITNVVSSGRQVIVHEVGHNWFYGILGSNERVNPWMDESINTYYETRSNSDLSRPSTHESFWSNIKVAKQTGEFDQNVLGPPKDLLDFLYSYSARKNEDQAGNLPATAYTDFNYGAIIYAKNPKAFFYLQAYLGDSLFDAMMHAYYEKWKFKHPLADDFFDHAEKFTGKDLGWFKNGILGSERKQDWKVRSIKKYKDNTTVTIRNKSTMMAPVSVQTMLDDSVTSSTWVITDKKSNATITLPNAPHTKIRVDAYEQTLDLFRRNNTIRSSGIFKKMEPISFHLFGDLENPYENRIFFSPILGANLYNKFMLGGAFYNSIMPRERMEYIIAPMYAFGTKDLVGHAEIERHFLTYGWFRNITLGVSGTRFASQTYYYSTEPVATNYLKIAPYLRFDFTKRNERTSPEQSLLLRYLWIYESLREAPNDNVKPYGYISLDYSLEKHRKTNSYSVKANYQAGVANEIFHKVSAEAEKTFTYMKNKGITARVFGGAFLQKPDVDRVMFIGVGNTGQYDYLYDYSQFGRGENYTSGSLFAQQLMTNGTRFSVAKIKAKLTDSWISSFNLVGDIPKLPLQLYADMIYMNERKFNDDPSFSGQRLSYERNFYFTGGVRLSLFSKILQINFPLVASKNITDEWSKSYGQRISFVFNLNALNPVKAARNVKF